MRYRKLGDVEVSAIGLGAMPMTKPGREDERSVATVHAALDAGVTLIDTADSYFWEPGAVGLNERLVATALRTYDGDVSRVLVATKGGSLNPGFGRDWSHCGRSDYLKWAARGSAHRLGVDSIALYQHHRPDPRVPYEESIGALRDLLDEGLIRAAGISNVDAEQIRIAHDILGDALVSVQNRFSPSHREAQAELLLCQELGLAFLPWSPMGGIGNAHELGGEIGRFAEVAARHGVSPQRVCLAWELALSPRMIPIPGASRPENIIESALAADLELGADEVAFLTGSESGPDLDRGE